MKQTFDLNLEKSKEFLKYFNAALRDPTHGFLKANGSSHFEDGFYICEQSVNFEYKSQKLFVVWKIILKPDGSLVSIENLNSKDSDFDLLVSQFLNEIIQKVLNAKRDKFFLRVYYKTISGCNLSGEYWLPGFRLAPLFPDDTSSLINAERIIVIDQNVKAIDSDHAREVALENASRFSAYLSFIMDLGLFEPVSEERYFLIRDSSSFKMERRSTQLMDLHPITELPRKGQICSLGKYEHSVFDHFRFLNQTLVCPKETRKIIKGIETSDEKIRKAFFKSCLLYKLAKTAGRQYPTVQISYECAAVESIVKSDNKQYKSFSDFMTKYAGDHKDLFDVIYDKIRSAHWHAGELVLGELDFSFDYLTSPSKMITMDVIMAAHEKMRKAILNWLNEQICFTSDSSIIGNKLNITSASS